VPSGVVEVAGAFAIDAGVDGDSSADRGRGNRDGVDEEGVWGSFEGWSVEVVRCDMAMDVPCVFVR